MKELDTDRLVFSPKLSVTAILNGGNGVFDIRIIESNSLTGYQVFKDDIRNGEIRLYEDDVLFLSISGPIDLSRRIDYFDVESSWGRNGYRWISGGINTRTGSVYRLEVDIEGFPLAVSTSVMPAAPVVSANMDTSVQIIKKFVKEIGSVRFYLNTLEGFEFEKYPDMYWPFSVRMDASDTGNYFALDILGTAYNNNSSVSYWWGIGASDLSILLEDYIDGEMMSGELADLYLFPLLMTGNLKNAPRNFYAAVVEIPNYLNENDSNIENDPNLEKITTHHSLTLRVRNITPSTYMYYRTLSLQFNDTGIFAEQPTTVVGNIEGGYGSFAVYNTASIPLVEWETYDWREKEK